MLERGSGLGGGGSLSMQMCADAGLSARRVSSFSRPRLCQPRAPAMILCVAMNDQLEGEYRLREKQKPSRVTL